MRVQLSTCNGPPAHTDASGAQYSGAMTARTARVGELLSGRKPITSTKPAGSKVGP